MRVYDWLMLTSIASLIVATIYVVYILRRVQRKLNEQTNQVRLAKESLVAIPDQVVAEVSLTYDEMKRKVQLGWRVFSFFRKRRQRKKMKKREKKG